MFHLNGCNLKFYIISFGIYMDKTFLIVGKDTDIETIVTTCNYSYSRKKQKQKKKKKQKQKQKQKTKTK